MATQLSHGLRGKTCMGLGGLFYWAREKGPKVSRAHSFLENLNHKSENLKLGKRKKRVAKINQDL